MNNVKNVDVWKHIFGNFKLEELMNKAQFNSNALNVVINGKMIDDFFIKYLTLFYIIFITI